MVSLQVSSSQQVGGLAAQLKTNASHTYLPWIPLGRRGRSLQGRRRDGAALAARERERSMRWQGPRDFRVDGPRRMDGSRLLGTVIEPIWNRPEPLSCQVG